MDVLLRFGIALAFVSLVGGGVWLARGVMRRRSERHHGEALGELGEALGLAAGVPAIVYLSTARCVDCRERQEPALEQLQSRVRVEVRKLDAAHSPEVTSRFSILSVPSTVVVDGDGIVRGVNVGFADAAKLEAQLGG